MTRENFDLAAFAKEVHYNAREHGWWDEERSEAEVRALIHSEWSEALEEARAGRPLVWKECLNTKEPCMKEDCGDYWNGKCEMGDLCRKPEGVAVELMDGCIRILDLFGKLNVGWVEKVSQTMIERMSCKALRITVEQMGIADLLANTIDRLSVAEVVDILHTATATHSETGENSVLLTAYGIACAWVRAHGLDPVELLIEKHEYNKSRPYKHGKKF